MCFISLTIILNKFPRTDGSESSNTRSIDSLEWAQSSRIYFLKSHAAYLESYFEVLVLFDSNGTPQAGHLWIFQPRFVLGCRKVAVASASQNRRLKIWHPKKKKSFQMML